MNLRRAAKGRACLIRIAGCRGDGTTTVLCHYRLAGTSGIAFKPDDRQAAFGCDYCHDVVDGRRKAPPGYTRDQVRLAHCEGVLRTQALVRDMRRAA